MKKTILLALAVPAFAGALAFFPVDNQKNTFHTEAELAFFRQHNIPSTVHRQPSTVGIPIDSNILFPTAKTCGGCHGKDPNGNAMVTNDGTDVNIYDDWRSTMMANAARDPFWRAKVSHEMLVNPAHSLELQDKCTSCHAPAGHYQAKLHDYKQFYTLADLYADTLGLDGVTCQACHAQAPERLGDLHSGELSYDTNYIRVAYGPYEFIFAPPMHQFVGITPEYGEHILDAGQCAGCHTLITKTVDNNNGAYTGNTFVEQATYHEWLNSRYDEAHDNVTCQGCHMPYIPDAVVISANYQFLTNKFPYALHELAGANVTMLKLMKENSAALGINALPEHFDSTIAATLRMLQQKTLDMSLETGILNGDSAHFTLKLANKAGHKFPSGYPARRAWIEFEVKNQNGETVFHSGRTNPDFSLPDEDTNFEPHYNLIENPSQVQIYELVPGDVNGLFTNVLERAHLALKDNRLVPQGFSPDDPAYDTTRVYGLNGDPDFDFDAGSDMVHFRIPNNGYTGFLTVTARVWYQSLPPKWMAPMFDYSSPEINAFKTMFDAADRSPVLVAEQVLDSVFVSPVSTKNIDKQKFVKIFPTLNRDGRVTVQAAPGVRVQKIQVWDASGKLVQEGGASEFIWLPERRGIYLVAVTTNKGKTVEKVVRE
ncbi:MAG: hypothetical protein OHK0019_00010 [Saprospiraceae bacterium]